MISILSLIFPGAGQLQRGDPRRAATLFGSALVTGLLTGGLGWLACGVWSAIDLQRMPPKPASTHSPSGGLSPTASGPKASGPNTSIGWIFKFSTLAICAAIVFHTVGSGNALQTLKFFGVEMQFGSALATQVDRAIGGADAPASETSGAASAGEPIAAAAFRDEPITPIETAVAPAAPPPAAASFAGTWTSAEGARYDIAQYGDDVEIRETSYILYMPVETMVCAGTIEGSDLQAYCTTYAGTTGEARLSVAGGALVGHYLDYVGGARIPIRLTR